MKSQQTTQTLRATSLTTSLSLALARALALAYAPPRSPLAPLALPPQQKRLDLIRFQSELTTGWACKLEAPWSICVLEVIEGDDFSSHSRTRAVHLRSTGTL